MRSFTIQELVGEILDVVIKLHVNRFYNSYHNFDNTFWCNIFSIQMSTQCTSSEAMEGTVGHLLP